MSVGEVIKISTLADLTTEAYEQGMQDTWHFIDNYIDDQELIDKDDERKLSPNVINALTTLLGEIEEFIKEKKDDS